LLAALAPDTQLLITEGGPQALLQQVWLQRCLHIVYVLSASSRSAAAGFSIPKNSANSLSTSCE
jgi:hypothetical protein